MGFIAGLDDQHREDQHREEWERIKVTVDSGAVDWVAPPHVAAAVERRENNASRNGMYYRAANGGQLPNMGEKVIDGLTDDWEKAKVTVQVAEVTKVLGSVSKICEAGNRVVFDEGGSYIESKSTGRRTKLEKDKGVYCMCLWVKGKEGSEDASALGFGGLDSVL